MYTKNRRIKNIFVIILYVITNGSLMCWTCFLGKKIEEDLTKVQLFKLLLSLKKDEEGIPIENRLTAKPMYVL